MGSGITLQFPADAVKTIRDRLQYALAMSVEIMGRTGEEACRHAMILMAQSARALTMKSKATRPVLRDGASGGSGRGDRLKGARFVEVFEQGKKQPSRVYEYFYKFGFKGRPKFSGSFDDAKKIKNQGLAKRSWMWGLRAINGPAPERSPIRGTYSLHTISSEKTCGYIKENKLSYITEAMPASWESDVAMAATNKIMKQAQMKIERKWVGAVKKEGRASVRTLQSFFLPLAS